MEKRWEYVGLLQRGLETKMGDSEEIFERERVCVCGRLMKWLKMKRDQKIEGKFRTRWGNLKVYCGGLLACQWNAAIDLMYSSSSKKAPQYVTYSGSFYNCRKKPAAIARFSYSVHLH